MLYEAFPIALIAENAGGKASDGKIDILDLQPEKHHQRTPLFVGNPKNVDEVLQALKEG